MFEPFDAVHSNQKYINGRSQGGSGNSRMAQGRKSWIINLSQIWKPSFFSELTARRWMKAKLAISKVARGSHSACENDDQQFRGTASHIALALYLIALAFDAVASDQSIVGLSNAVEGFDLAWEFILRNNAGCSGT